MRSPAQPRGTRTVVWYQMSPTYSRTAGSVVRSLKLAGTAMSALPGSGPRYQPASRPSRSGSRAKRHSPSSRLVSRVAVSRGRSMRALLSPSTERALLDQRSPRILGGLRSRRASSARGAGSADGAVGVDDVLRRRALVELLVAARCVVQADDLGVDRLGDVDPVVEDRLHEAAVVLHHRRLAGDEGQRLGPAGAEVHRQRAALGGLVDAARVTGDVQAR